MRTRPGSRREMGTYRPGMRGVIVVRGIDKAKPGGCRRIFSAPSVCIYSES